ncbi:ATP-binding cassette domain-containing protein [Acidiphilium sp. AL]|uniref:ATP-binding cassette domain-containing protein n=1 Tax=Acidiphilium iwatense TaxID=768198 RepID=A0ABS9DVB2_9PROT|nr:MULTISPECIES: ATP-binding cassette domain-containing protein [Acidiphilium]MCF3946666.1 ATP-binding cassette domain-containing protein [Acidiphilium iwatense]MCU4159991.1 ATP-binding cassette domain-containing protein [Acidiphilium sp. AL]
MPERLSARGLTGAAGGPFGIALGRGDAMAITGPSGAGKSVLLRMIADLDPHEGAILLDGVDRATIAAPLWRRRVAYLAAEPGWWHDDTAPHFPDRPRTEALMPSLALDPGLLNQPVHRLSTGERMRLAFIRTLLNEPEILLLDEPTGALDPHATALVETLLIERLRAGAALILVTHDMAQASRLGARRFHLEAGTLTPR